MHDVSFLFLAAISFPEQVQSPLACCGSLGILIGIIRNIFIYVYEYIYRNPISKIGEERICQNSEISRMELFFTCSDAKSYLEKL